MEEEREGGGWGSEEEKGGLVRDTVRGCLARGPNEKCMQGKKQKRKQTYSLSNTL